MKKEIPKGRCINDVSGRGCAKLFGFDFLENFNLPYIATSIRDFWRRWHISLTNFFRDYLYIPLGGNRQSKLRTNINLMLVFFCTGIWHGASWNFILWGLWHGLFLLIERSSAFFSLSLPQAVNTTVISSMLNSFFILRLI